MTKQRARMTAAEHAAQLEADPVYQERTRKHEEERARDVAEYEEAEKSVLDSLRRLGLDVRGITELWQRPLSPLKPSIVNLLLEQLPQVSHKRVQDSMIRALTNVRKPYDGSCIVRMFENPHTEGLRWVIGNTIAESRPTGISEWLCAAVRNPTYGKNREMLLLALARLVPPQRANPILLSLFDEFPGHVALALTESGGPAELEFLRSVLDKNSRWHAWVRKEVGKAIRKIEKRLQ